MPSDFLTPFLEVDEEFCKNFRGLETADGSSCSLQQRVLGFQRRHSLCPVTLPNSKFNSSSELLESGCWGLGLAPQQHWNRELPQSSLSHIPFRVDRSVSMIEGRADKSVSPPLLLPPPGLCVNNNNNNCGASPRAPVPPPHISTRYKTELCRTYEESGSFHTIGFCPYGARCHFIHNADEIQAAPHRQKLRPPPLRHSLSFAGFSSSRHTFQPVESQPSSLLFTRASSVSPPPSSIGSPELLSPLFPEPGTLRHCPHLFAGLHDLSGDGGFSAVTDSSSSSSSTSSSRCSPTIYKNLPPLLPQPDFLGLQRSSSADSLSEEGYTSSCSLSSSSSSGTESPSFEGRRLPIFSRLSVSDE